MGLDFLNGLIAQLLSKFKTGNPVIFVIVASLLSAVKFALDSGVFPVDPKIAGWALWIVGLVLGTPTTKFLKSE
jgi:hypothetical protein